MNPDKKANRKFKDSVFTALFSNEQNVIELYNAIDGKNYPPDTAVKINTLEDVLFLDRINDISFILDNKLVVLVEQQASINMNMPLRFLLYISRIYEKIIASDELNIYKRSLTKIPKPEFICLYNGNDDFPDEMILKLSDAFVGSEEHDWSDLDLTVRVLNINAGKNEDIINGSKILSGYVLFIGRVKSNIENGYSLENAIDETVKHCILNGILEDFLNQYRSEVISMLAKEFNLDLALRAERQDGIEEGIREGIREGIKEGIKEVVIRMLEQKFPDNDIISIARITPDKLTQYKELLINQH